MSLTSFNLWCSGWRRRRPPADGSVECCLFPSFSPFRLSLERGIYFSVPPCHGQFRMEAPKSVGRRHIERGRYAASSSSSDNRHGHVSCAAACHYSSRGIAPKYWFLPPSSLSSAWYPSSPLVEICQRACLVSFLQIPLTAFCV